MSLAKDVIDGIAEVIEDLDLPDHNTYLYRRPKSLLPEDTPALVVWLRSKTPAPQTTIWFDGVLVVGVSWHQESVDETTTQEMDEQLSLDLMDNMALIEQAVRTLSVNGWSVARAYEVVPGETAYLEPLREAGLTEGYTLDVLVRVTEEG